MTDSVLSGVRECPFDWTRWAVASDWLEDREDPRAAMYRAVSRLGSGHAEAARELSSALLKLLGAVGIVALTDWESDPFRVGFGGPRWSYSDEHFPALRWLPNKVFLGSAAITEEVLDKLEDSFAFGLAVHYDGAGRIREAGRAGLRTLTARMRANRCGWLRSFELAHIGDEAAVGEVLDCFRFLPELQEVTIGDAQIPLGSLERLGELPGLRSLILDQCWLAREEGAPLDVLLRMPKLERLTVKHIMVESLDPRVLEHQSGLTDLFVMERSLRPGWLEPIRNMERLHRLGIVNNQAPEEVLPFIGGLVNLRSLSFRSFFGPQLSLRLPLDPLADLVNLEALDLGENVVGAPHLSVLSPLGALPALKSLSIHSARLSHSGRRVLVPLGTSAALEVLDLGQNELARLGEGVLAPLEALPRLRDLNLSHTGYRPETPEVARLLHSRGMRAVTSDFDRDLPHAKFEL